MTLNLFCLCVWGCAEDLNWNALEWDRAAEELTWERVRDAVSTSCHGDK